MDKYDNNYSYWFWAIMYNIHNKFLELQTTQYECKSNIVVETITVLHIYNGTHIYIKT